MALTAILSVYLLIALSVAWTSYFTIWKQAGKLVTEILEEKTLYTGFTGFIMWTIIATVLAPGVMILLLSNNNEYYATKLATVLIEKSLEDDD